MKTFTRLLLVSLAVAAACDARATSVAYATAQSGFPNRDIGVYSATQDSNQTHAESGIGYATISGNIPGSDGVTRSLAGTQAYSRTDFSVVGLTTNAPLTFTWHLLREHSFLGTEAAYGGDSAVGAFLSPNSGGSYSFIGNLVVQNFQGSLGNPASLVGCNGNTRGQAVCGTRVDLSADTYMSITGLVGANRSGYIEQSLAGDGWSTDFFAIAELISVTVPDAVYFADGSQGTQFGLNARGFQPLPEAYLEWEDGSRMSIALAASNDVPEPSSLALAALGVLGCTVRRQRKTPIRSQPISG